MHSLGLFLLNVVYVLCWDGDSDDADLPWLNHELTGSDYRDYTMANTDYPYWPDNLVPVKFDVSVSKEERNVVWSIIHNINHKLQCIRFVDFYKASAQRERFLLIKKKYEAPGKGCTTYYDVPTMRIVVKFSEIKNTKYDRMVITHELLHVLGLGHTAMRKDRDQYVKVLYENIPREKYGQYDKCENCDLLDIPYDCSSIMHYRRCRYGTEPCDNPVYEAMDPASCDVKHFNYNMSETDIEAVRRLNCPDVERNSKITMKNRKLYKRNFKIPFLYRF